MSTLFSSLRIGRNTLRNRLVMAPMTRSRADDASGVPSPLAVTYYGQRAGAGLIITEGVFPSPMGKGYVRTPGIGSAEQGAAWKKIVDEVHAAGGLIFLQLMHSGRISHPSMLPGGALPVAPSAIKPAGQSFTATGLMDFVEPRTLGTEEVAAVIEEYANAARLAIEAGFDGVELHAASGYLPEQFLSSGTNHRSDRFGGSLAKRATFILETLEAMSAAIGSDRVGIKICPEMGFNDLKDEQPVQTYSYLVEQLSGMKLAYLHVATSKAAYDYHSLLRPLFKGVYLLGGGLSKEKAEQRIASGQADAAVFGSAFLANPDLPQRFVSGTALNQPNPALFYAPGAAGYIDYPVHEEPAMTRALRIHAYGGVEALQLDTLAIPVAGEGEVVVRVRAAGINGLDWKIRDGLVRDAFPLPLPATLGLELAGEIVETGPGVNGFAVGERVMAALGGLGAYADYVVVAADKIAPVPAGLDDVRAAAMPVAALTAWQSLFETGNLQKGETVLIHGAAGAVGSFAVQFARQAGARVVATARGVNADLLRSLGADEVIDYQESSFRERAADIDLVLDLVGGATLQHSWDVLSAKGRIVSTAAPEIVATVPVGKQGTWFAMRPDARQLAGFAAQVAQGKLQVLMADVVPVAQAAAAIEQNKTGHGAGKTVIRF
ncbi:MAG: zinc-binding dehydrogenase [Collimonas sp.]|uniref:oxidoreductase n=1 Tax=Collimonas sp. TaxID=1963772 RepID=UPI003267ADDB